MMHLDPRLPDRELFADADAMSDALGRRVRIERIRYKPGTSIVAAVRDEEGRPLWVLDARRPGQGAQPRAPRAARGGAP